MLKTPEHFAGASDPMFKILAAVRTGTADHIDFDPTNDENDIDAEKERVAQIRQQVDALPEIEIEIIEEGYFICPTFNVDTIVWGHNGDFDMAYPAFKGWDLNSFGVCDTPQQFIDKFGDLLKDDERTFCVGFTHVAKNPDERGGWRWHKWGPYIGDGEPAYEYLAEEEGFEDGVYVYHILQIDGPNNNIGNGPVKFHKDDPVGQRMLDAEKDGK